MRIGYACLTVGVNNANLKSCILKNANGTRLMEITEHNLNSLENIINYNIQNNIRLFRISSNLIPFASIPEQSFSWHDHYAARLKLLGEKAKENGLRLSMHPGQYTVLNSPNKEIVERAIADLHFHSDLLDSMGLGSDSKIVLHIGGIYQDKKQAAKRFILHFNYLADSIKRRIVLENDDKSYNVNDVLEIATQLNLPVVFDNLHHLVNPALPEASDIYWIEECQKTWKEQDGCQKIHYSQQEPLKRPGSHSSTIRIKQFLDFYEQIKLKNLDIMLEVKDKNLSAVKCINCTSENQSIKILENEWSKYKYFVLEKAPDNYSRIRKMLNNKKGYPAVDFYEMLEDALQRETQADSSLNAMQHVWGYFKDLAAEKEKSKFFDLVEKYQQGELPLSTVKNFLWKMAIKYQEHYLLNSYYFSLNS